MFLITIVWVILVFIGIKKEQRDSISKVNMSALRGLAALEIMMGHIGLETNSIALYPNRKAGILFVGIFFVLSGYGLVYSFTEKKNYLKGFLVSKLIKILIPAYMIYVLFIILDSVLNKTQILRAINPLEFVKGTNWYVWEILFFYLVFYCSYRLLDGRKADTVVGGISVGLILLCYFLQVNNPWYGSTLCFWAGIMYYRKEEKIKRIFDSRPYLYLVGAVVLMLSILIFFVDQKGFIGLVCARNLAAIVFSILVLLLLYKYQIGNVVTNWLGKISYEIFLIHPFVIELLRDRFSSALVYAWSVIAVTLFWAILTKKIEKWVVLRKRNKH